MICCCCCRLLLFFGGRGGWGGRFFSHPFVCVCVCVLLVFVVVWGEGGVYRSLQNWQLRQSTLLSILWRRVLFSKPDKCCRWYSQSIAVEQRAAVAFCLLHQCLRNVTPVVFRKLLHSSRPRTLFIDGTKANGSELSDVEDCPVSVSCRIGQSYSANHDLVTR